MMSHSWTVTEIALGRDLESLVRCTIFITQKAVMKIAGSPDFIRMWVKY